MENVVQVFKMLTRFDRVRIFYILSVVFQSYMKRGFWLSDKLQRIYIKIFFCLGACKGCGGNYLFAWQAPWCITCNVFSFSRILLKLQKFFGCLWFYLRQWFFLMTYFCRRVWLVLLWMYFRMYCWYLINASAY